MSEKCPVCLEREAEIDVVRDDDQRLLVDCRGKCAHRYQLDRSAVEILSTLPQTERDDLSAMIAKGRWPDEICHIVQASPSRVRADIRPCQWRSGGT